MAENHHLDSEPPPTAGPVRDLRRWSAALLLACVIVGFYWKLVMTREYTWLNGADIVNQVLPWFQMEMREWHSGRVPMWDPYQWCGQPLLGQAQPGVFYPLNLLLFHLPARDGQIRQYYLHWYLVVIHLMAAWFAYKLARELGCRRLSSALGGAAFSLCAWMGSVDWPQHLNSAIWAPLVLLYVFRAIRGRAVLASSGLAGFFLGMSLLGGHHQIPTYVSLACGGVWLWTLAHKRNLRLLAAFALFWVMAAGTAAVQALPSREYGKLSVRWVSAADPVGWDQKVPYDVHRTFSVSPGNLPGILTPGLFHHADPFTGVAVFGLALLGVLLRWNKKETRLLTAISMGGLLFAMAPHTPLHGVLYSLVPMVEKARNPAMAVFLFGLGASLLSALGLDALLDRRDSPWARRVAASAGVLGALLFSVRLGAIAVGHQGGSDMSAVTALAGVLFCAAMFAWIRGAIAARSMALCALGIFLMEVTHSNGFYMPSVQEKERVAALQQTQADGDIAAYLREHAGVSRVYVDDRLVPYNFGDWQGIQQMTGYLASLTKNMQIQELHLPVGRRLFGVEYFVGKEPRDAYQEELFRGASGLKVYRNPDVLPRAFAVHEAYQIADKGQGPQNLAALGAEMGRKTFVAGAPPALERCGGEDSVKVTSYVPGQVTLSAAMACRGMAILTDTYFPGWVAKVDGRETPIYEAYGVVRGVVVESGQHTVEFVYRPSSVMLGGLLTVLASLGAVACFVFSRRAARATS